METLLWLVMFLAFVVMTTELKKILKHTKQVLASGKSTVTAGTTATIFIISTLIFGGALYLFLQQPM